MNPEQLLEYIQRLEARIAELELDLYANPDMADRRARRQLTEQFKRQGMSGRKARDAAWHTLHDPNFTS
ncbi:hypothetical protein [Burkholderia pseudomallei]|uniref:hypothetical protein n=1 Tax=Burkholderia pseudomallei TaxID=28450 RepID=UPI0005385CB4|nr:hypothetical protein [Burkholderia pseudomallei]KGX20096.1 hypothetical protein X896_773 [Burkholderia pseudomallei ABCPW 1]